MIEVLKKKKNFGQSVGLRAKETLLLEIYRSLKLEYFKFGVCWCLVCYENLTLNFKQCVGKWEVPTAKMEEFPRDTLISLFSFILF